MSFHVQNVLVRSIRLIALNIIVSAFLGIIVAAISQRINDVFFYNVFVGAFFSGVTSFLIFKLKLRNFVFKNTFRPYAITISVLLSFSFLSTIPLTIDRSYSVWLLKHIAEEKSPEKLIDRETLVRDSANFFSAGNGQLIRRIDEQVMLGNLELEDAGSIKLSSKGLFIARVNHLVGIIFDLEPKYSRLKTR
jgi:hypothetical protein